MIMEKVLTKEEQNHLLELESQYSSSDAVYQQKLEEYLREINFVDRAADYLDNRWYTKIFRFFCGGRKKKKKYIDIK